MDIACCHDCENVDEDKKTFPVCKSCRKLVFWRWLDDQDRYWAQHTDYKWVDDLWIPDFLEVAE